MCIGVTSNMLKEFDKEDDVLVSYNAKSHIVRYIEQLYGEQIQNREYSLNVHVDDVTGVEYDDNITGYSTHIPYIHIGLTPPLYKTVQQKPVFQSCEDGLVNVPTSDTYSTYTLELKSTIFHVIDDGKFKYVSKHMTFDGVRRFRVFALDKTKVHPFIDTQMKKSLALIDDLYENGWTKEE